MVSLLPIPEIQIFSNDGTVASGGTIAQYISGTLSPKTSWTDPSGTTANANPLTLNAGGRCTLYGEGSYRLIIKDAAGNLIMDADTASTLAESTISEVMLPVTGAATLQTARDNMGITAAISTAVSSISLMPGPTGPIGPTGPAGPQGATGSAGAGASVNRQVFLGSGTWSRPSSGGIAIVQIWGAGGAGTTLTAGAGGGPGGYTVVACLLSDLASAVSVTIGSGGVYNPSAGAGANGGSTAFGGYLVQAGGVGGNVIFDADGTPHPSGGTSGFLQSAAGLNIIFGSSDQGTETGFDNFGNIYASAPFSGTPGTNVTRIPSIFGGSGGGVGSNGASAGGGGGVTGGSGGNGQIIVTVF